MAENDELRIRRLKDWNSILLFVIVVLLVFIYFHPNHTVMPTNEYNAKIDKTEREAKQEQMNELFGTVEALQSTMECAMWGLWWNDRLNPSLKPWFEATYDTYGLEVMCTDAGNRE